MAYQNVTSQVIVIRDSRNVEITILPGEEIEDVDHPRLQACISNGELLCTDLPEPKIRIEAPIPPPPPADIKEAILDLAEEHGKKEDKKEEKKSPKRGAKKRGLERE